MTKNCIGSCENCAELFTYQLKIDSDGCNLEQAPEICEDCSGNKDFADGLKEMQEFDKYED